MTLYKFKLHCYSFCSGSFAPVLHSVSIRKSIWRGIVFHHTKYGGCLSYQYAMELLLRFLSVSERESFSNARPTINGACLLRASLADCGNFSPYDQDLVLITNLSYCLYNHSLEAVTIIVLKLKFRSNILLVDHTWYASSNVINTTSYESTQLWVSSKNTMRGFPPVLREI